MQQTQNNEPENFRAVEFMRIVRTKHSEEYRTDPQRYLDRARQAMEAFKMRRAPISNAAHGSGSSGTVK